MPVGEFPQGEERPHDSCANRPSDHCMVHDKSLPQTSLAASAAIDFRTSTKEESIVCD